MPSHFTAADVARLQQNRAKASTAPRHAPQGTAVAPVPTPARARPVTAKKPRHLEDDLQQACVSWFRYQYPALAPLLFAIPNGGQRGKIEAARMQRTGTTPGVPDLQLAVPVLPFAGLFLELKVGTNRPSPVQRSMLDRLSAAGYRAVVVYSLAEFVGEIKGYLGGKIVN